MKNKKILVSKLVLILLIIIILIIIIFPPKSIAVDKKNGEMKNTIGELYSGDVLIQQIKATEKYTSFAFELATYEKKLNKGELIIEIDDGTNVKKTIMKLSEISDNTKYDLKYNFKKNKIYKIRFLIRDSDYPITIYSGNNDDKNSILTINDKKQKNGIFLEFYYKKNTYFSILYCLFLIIVDLLYIAITLNGVENNDR